MGRAVCARRVSRRLRAGQAGPDRPFRHDPSVASPGRAWPLPVVRVEAPRTRLGCIFRPTGAGWPGRGTKRRNGPGGGAGWPGGGARIEAPRGTKTRQERHRAPEMRRIAPRKCAAERPPLSDRRRTTPPLSERRPAHSDPSPATISA
ncbi:MAG: hypothetical protein E4H24_07050 [Thermomicrobiales bacterium]|nr:MAG: hypothetical protein E4H24_07050 [Thermomicrobiales bacterium]